MPRGIEKASAPAEAEAAPVEAATSEQPVMRINRVVSARVEPPTHPALTYLDPYTSFLYKPHTITFLLLGIGAVIYYSNVFDPQPLPETKQMADQMAYDNCKKGVVAIISVFLAYCVLQGPRTPMVRPHPAFWKLVHGVLMLYLLLLVFLLFQTAMDARMFLRHFNPKLGVPLKERAYGGDCRLWIPEEGTINWPTIKDTVFDEFVVAHTLGWWGKAIIMRNYPMLWVLSIGFELMELTFQHMLANFNECWWDSWILDVALCNFIGMVTGMMTVRSFQAREYDWRGISQQPSLFGKVRRSFLQFTPYSVDRFNWSVTASPMRLLQCLLPVAIFLLFEVNAFFLKFILWIPPPNMLNIYRLFILFFGAIPAVKEYYDFIEAEQDPFNKLGASAWLALAIAIAEVLLCIKHGRGMFPEPWPTPVVVGWSIFLGLATVIIATWSLRYYVLAPRAEAAAALSSSGRGKAKRS